MECSDQCPLAVPEILWSVRTSARAQGEPENRRRPFAASFGGRRISLGWGGGINGGPNSVQRIPTYPLSGCASTGGRIPTYPLEDLSLVTDVTVVCNGQMSAPPARQPPSKIGAGMGAGEEMRGVADDPKVASKINFAGIRPRARSCRPAGLRNLEWPRVGVTVA